MSSLFSGIGDWLRGPAGGMGAPAAPPGGGMSRGQMLGNIMGGVGRSLSGGGTIAGGLGDAASQIQQQRQGPSEEELWAMLQKLVAERGLPGQQQPPPIPGGRISGPPGQPPGMGPPPIGGLY